LIVEAPLLVGLLANKDPAARQYAEWTGKAARSDGLRYELRILDDAIDVEAALLEANRDPRVHGIIIYYPIFGQTESFSGASQDDYLRDSVRLECDVEGLCHTYRSNLYRNVRYLQPPQYYQYEQSQQNQQNVYCRVRLCRSSKYWNNVRVCTTSRNGRVNI
jgi:methylenetetrahydrofolate dehydrogenase (NAD+)